MKNKMEHIYMYLLFLLIYWWKSWKGWQIAEEAESACFAKYEVFFRWFSLRWKSERIPFFSMTTSNTILLILSNIFRKLVNCKNYWIFELLGGLNSSLRIFELIPLKKFEIFMLRLWSNFTKKFQANNTRLSFSQTLEETRLN